MMGKDFKLYSEVFKCLKEKFPHIEWPEHMMCDFEKSLRKALHASFPGTQVHGCRFHFNQALFRKLQKGSYSYVF
jgi:hypothetical protein